MFFKIRLFGISQIQTNDDSIFFLKLTFRNIERLSEKFLCTSERCFLESEFIWHDPIPIDESDILTIELYKISNFNKTTSIKKISLYQTLMESYSPYRIYYLSEQLENGVNFNFSLYYENDLLVKSFNKQLSHQFNCKPLNIIDFTHCFKQSDSSKSTKIITYGTFNH